MKPACFAAWVGALLLCLPFVCQADTADAASSPIGFGSRGYQWNSMTAEQVAVMKLNGDPVRGKEAFRGCQGCHRSDASGRSDGTYPRLDGQHAAVIIKQVTDTRAGIRINPKMGPFASEHAVTPQEIADIAIHLASLRGQARNGQGDAALASRGEALYRQRGCAECHGGEGRGSASSLYPAVAAQHYAYLLRELEHIQAGQRGNSHPDMIRSLKGCSPEELQALASFMSRMPPALGTGRAP